MPEDLEADSTHRHRTSPCQGNQHDVDEQADRPQRTNDGRKQREPLDLFRDELVRKARRAAAFTPTGRCLEAWRNDLYGFGHGFVGVIRCLSSSRLRRIDACDRIRSPRISSRSLTVRLRRPAVLEERPQTRAHERRQRGLEVFERRAPQVLVAGQEPAIGNLQRLGGLHERQQRKDVRQPLVRPVLDELVHEGAIARVVQPVEQPMALPHGAADRHLAEHHGVNRHGFDANLRVLGDDRRQRAAALKADFEALVVEAEDQSVRRALRRAHREDPRQATPHGERTGSDRPGHR